MNNKIIKCLCAVIISSMLLTGCNKEEKKVVTLDETKFKTEYESYNNKAKESGTGTHLEIELPESNHMKYASYEEVMKVLENGTGVIFFSFPTCPWCRNAAPVLAQSANTAGVEEILYFNALSIRDKKVLDADGNIITEKEGTKEYYALVDKLKDALPEYGGLNDPTLKRLYFPTVIFVKDGKIVKMLDGTVDSQEDPSIHLNVDQTNELSKIYKDAFALLGGAFCDSGC